MVGDRPATDGELAAQLEHPVRPGPLGGDPARAVPDDADPAVVAPDLLRLVRDTLGAIG